MNCRRQVFKRPPVTTCRLLAFLLNVYYKLLLTSFINLKFSRPRPMPLESILGSIIIVGKLENETGQETRSIDLGLDLDFNLR